MRILKNKELLKIIISGLCLLISILFYVFSSLLRIIFNKILVIVGIIVIIGLLIAQLVCVNNEKMKKILETINDYVQIFLIAILMVEIIFTFIMFPATVSQNSMYPTLLPNEQLIIKCTKKIENNDIIVFKYDTILQPENIGVPDDELLVKRVIAVPGQTFKYVGKQLYIDGVLMEDKFAVDEMDGLDLKYVCQLNGMYEECLQEDGSFVLPEGWYVVFGDNRRYTANGIPVSIDSRSFGLIHESQIFGTAEFKVENLIKWTRIGE